MSCQVTCRIGYRNTERLVSLGFKHQFEARHGTHAREVAAQALLKLSASVGSEFTPVQPRSFNGAMHSTFVTGALLALSSD